MSSVLQPWVETMPWKCQSILFSGLRGPDHALCKKIKEVSRWMRKVSQKDADPSQSYMAPKQLPMPEELEKELEHGPIHFAHHFADALRCIALWHPDQETRVYARTLHFYMADELFHWKPETDEEFKHRHRDRVEHD
jgi:hypothetical protein